MKTKHSDKDKDVLKNLGRFIESQFKKSLHKVEEVFKDNKAADDKLFSYFKVFIDDKGVASVTPSSKYLVDRVLKAMDLKHNKIVVEYGAASGVMTRKILERLAPDGRIVSIELNEKLFESLRELTPDSRLHPYRGDVREVDRIARHYGLQAGGVDVIISGIPFAFLSHAGRHELLDKTAALLRPGGRFIAYQVTTHLIPILKDHFKHVDTQFEIRNIPPHFVFTAYK